MKRSDILRKIAILVILTTLLSNSIYAESPSEVDENEDVGTYELYRYNEFPDWLHKVRRAESLFIGSLPLSFGALTLAANLFTVNSSGSLDNDDYLFRIGISAAISLGIVLIDFILGELQNE